MPKYSFIVPVYNSGPYLEPCVSSLLAQTCQDFEILLIDDGSTDGSGAVCDQLAETDGRIRVFHKKNGGAASARNYGIDRAEGEYLLFIDGDDTIEPNTLHSVESAGTSDLVIFGMAFDYYDSRATLLRTEKLSTRHRGCKTADFFTGHFTELFEDNALSSACNKVFPAKKLRGSGLRFREDMTLYEDLEFVLRYFAMVETFDCVAIPLYHYRIDAESFGHKRVHSLPALQNNLSQLAETLLSMEPRPEGAADLAANLYLQLLLRHLLAEQYRKTELNGVYDYCREPQFRRALEMGAALNPQEELLLGMIDSGDGARLVNWINKKKTEIFLKRTAKKVLQLLGLRR